MDALGTLEPRTVACGPAGLVDEYRIFDVSYSRSWPLRLIGAGVLLIVRSQAPAAADAPGDGR